MARYRKIDVRMWGDERFQRLSKPQPCGQALFQYLLTCPSTTNVPGLFRAGRPQLADELEWSLEGFDKAFAELSREGLVKADWKARVVWIRGARKYNAPENPNVVKGWQSSIDELPECDLKTEALRVLKELCEGLGKGFPKAFEQACAKSLPNQEQEQEPDQEQEPEPESEGARRAVPEVRLVVPRPRPDPFAATLSSEAFGPREVAKLFSDLRRVKPDGNPRKGGAAFKLGTTGKDWERAQHGAECARNAQPDDPAGWCRVGMAKYFDHATGHAAGTWPLWGWSNDPDAWFAFEPSQPSAAARGMGPVGTSEEHTNDTGRF